MYETSGSSALQDPNVSRIVQETLNSVDDVERRLVSLKLGIAQNIPQLAPVLQAREVQIRDQVLSTLHQIVPRGMTQGFGGQQQGLGGMGQMQGQGLGISPFSQGNIGQGGFGQTGFGQGGFGGGFGQQGGFGQGGFGQQGGFGTQMGGQFQQNVPWQQGGQSYGQMGGMPYFRPW